MHSKPDGVALCSNGTGETCEEVPMNQTDKWFMVRPRDWQKLSDYMSLLICKLNGACANSRAESQESFVVTEKDLKIIQRKIKALESDLK